MLALVAAGLLVGPAATGSAASFDYLYIEANEGGSSGGHAAVRFGDRTYHFQNRDGLLVLDRERTADFFHAYALLSNRSIESRRVALSEADRERARDRFSRRHRAQDRQLDVLLALGEDRALLEAWRRGEPGPPIPGLGLFDLAAPASPRVAALGERIAAAHGAGFLQQRRAELETELARAAAADPAAWGVAPPTGVYDEPPFHAPFARRHRGVAASLAALAVLERRAPLDPASTFRPQDPRWWLAPDELERLDRTRRGLEDELVRLVASARRDWGAAFLVGLARLLALDESRALGRLVVLDGFPDDARRLDASAVSGRLEIVGSMLRAGHARVEEARAAWLHGETPGEREWVPVEDAAARVLELEAAVREGRDLRIVRGPLIPSRGARRPDASPPRRDDLELAIARVREREAHYREALEALYRYRLISRNCVSELFHTLNDAFEDSPAGSRDALGGAIDGHAGLAFIPFVSAAAVDREYRVVARGRLPSWRELQLAEMRRREHPVWVALRESNTLTARSYRRGLQDSWFLFFTDDAPALRPLLGAFNLLAGIGESLWGVARLPFDRGETLVSGLEGSLASLPELAFWNIRKGSNDWVERRPLEPAPPGAGSEH